VARHTQIHNGTFLVLEKGEELVSTLTRFCEERQIHWVQFQAIGAVEDVEIGYYDLEAKEYVFRQEPGPFEVSSMDGNVTELNSLPVPHIHAVLSRADESLETIGGHIRRATVHITLEMCLWEITQPLVRRFDDETGLNLIDVAV
jgi:uncharacterized protein